MKRLLTFAVLFLHGAIGLGQTAYRVPAKEIVEILDAPPTPVILTSPTSDAMLLVHYEPHPPLEMLARPYHGLAELRIDPARHGLLRTTRYTRIQILRVADGSIIDVAVPLGSSLGIPKWSHDARKIAFTRDVSDGVELWVADALSGTSRVIPKLLVNDILGSAFDWSGDNINLFVKAVPPDRGAPPKPSPVPAGPNIVETSGKFSQAATHQDLLRTAFDEDLFEYYAHSQLVLVDSRSGATRPVGEKGMLMSVFPSPDGRYLLVTRLKRPFSFRVPYYNFSRSIEVWNGRGSLVRTIADLPPSEEIPRHGVPTGPRGVQWQRLHGAKLIWVEALDGGDPLASVPHRERLMTLSAPFTAEPVEVTKVRHRFAGFEWSAKRDVVLLNEFDRDRRWRTTSLVDLRRPGERKTVFDLSVNDAYNDPGRPVYETRHNGESVMIQEGDWIYLSGRGASEEGDRPFLDRMNLSSLKKERLFRSGEKSVEQFVAFAPGARSVILTRYESQTEVPNYFVSDLRNRTRRALTQFTDPAPQLTRMKKELVKYARADGVPLSGTLYLPADYVPGTRLPVLIWAYPREYSDAVTGGQVRSAPNAFTFFRGTTPLFFVTQGYAVLMDATMPIVGDPETMNDTFVDQIVSSAQAALDKLDQMGVIDRNRALIAGHSYGAFMTANLLAHSDLFAAGIARSGAYNRTLTPFGFQSERRSFWEVPEIYFRVSPFMHANKINEPILLIHGEADNNSGTFPIQSERLFQAIQGLGGTARLVMLPHESHGYVARESVLHVIAEMLEWGEKYVKHRQVIGKK